MSPHFSPFQSPQDTYHLRLHRARSVQLTQDELIELRAIQRTFEGAYTRTALAQFSFALIILKIFTHEFYSVGALFAALGVCLYVVAVWRRAQGNRAFFSVAKDVAEGQTGSGLEEKRFRTSGNVVCVVAAMSVAAYVALLVLVLRMGPAGSSDAEGDGERKEMRALLWGGIGQ